MYLKPLLCVRERTSLTVPVRAQRRKFFKKKRKTRWAWVDEGSVVGERLYRSWARREPRFEAKDNCAAVLHRGSALSPASPARRYLF